MIPAVGYYTDHYQKEADQFAASLDLLGIPYDLDRVDDRGTWLKNVQQKPEVILRFMTNHPDVPAFFYNDVDAIVLQSPDLFVQIADDGFDIAFHLLGGTELLSGTLFFANNDKTRDLVRRWVELICLHPLKLPDGSQSWDQRVLHYAIREMDDLSIFDLPESYVWIRDGISGRHYGKNVEPVIVHTRASARLTRRGDDSVRG